MRFSRLHLVNFLAATVGLVAAGCSNDVPSTAPTPATATVTVSVEASPNPTTSLDSAEGPTTSAPPDGRLDTPPRTYDEAVGHFAAALVQNDVLQEFSRFATPTGNIYCVLDDPGIPMSCEISQGGVRDDAECIEAPNPLVGRIEFTERGFVPVCNSDTIRTPGPPVLGYGGVAAWTGSSFQCLAEEIGVTCISTVQEQGFFMARGRYQIFG